MRRRRRVVETQKIIPLMSKRGRKESTKERAEVAEKGLKVMNSAEMQRE